MTVLRRQRCRPRKTGAIRSILAVSVMAAGCAASLAATTEMVVTDRHTGLAISGFDPVAYFTDAKPMAGSEDFERTSAAVTWRFRNPGNMAAFAASPDVYTPRFGGYDPIAIARGASAPGHPELWMISGQRLYLFHSQAARDAFAINPNEAIRAADNAWPTVKRTLVP